MNSSQIPFVRGNKWACAVILAFLGFSMQPITMSYADHQHDHGNHSSHEVRKTQSAKRGMREVVVWTSYPTLKVMVGGDTRASRETTLLPKNISPQRIEAYSNNLSAADAKRELPYDLVTAKFGKPKTGGFNWIAAKEEQADREVVASTVYYMSERGSQNPTAMFMRQKHALEIIPQPFPREHSRYRAGEDWRFLVRFNAKPLVQQNVAVVTQNGSQFDLVSDAHGKIRLHIPDDFKSDIQHQPNAAHRHGRKSSEFVLATTYLHAGKTYITGFNSQYGPNAFDQRSILAGLGFMALGMIGAAPLLRNRKKSPKKADESNRGGVANVE